MADKPHDPSGIKAQVYKDDRPAEYFEPFHQRARDRKPDVVYEIVRVLTSLIGWIIYRGKSISPENVPDGPVILAPNHFSNLDHFFAGMALRRHVRFMAKSQLFKPPMQWVYTHGGVFPVRRGFRDDEVFVTAEKILDDGGCVLMYCEGGRSRTGGIGTEAKAGIGRLALDTGVPIVPIAIHGSSHVRHWRKFVLPKVTIQYGTPIRWDKVEGSTREQQQEVADEVLRQITEIYEGLETHGRRAVIKSARKARTAGAGQPAAS